VPHSANAKPVILVLDDDAAVLGSLQFLLETHGLAVNSFRSPASMLHWAERNSFDCVVLDYKMPDMDGLAVATTLRGRGISAPIILVTGYPDDTIFARAATAGIEQVLLKPNVEGSLIAHIQDRLATRRVAH